MTLTLPPILDALLAAHNAHDPAAFVACFSADAVVRDAGRRYFGQPAIRAWFQDLIVQHRPILDATSLAYIDGEPVLTVTVSSRFTPQALERRYHTALEDGKIVALKIAP